MAQATAEATFGGAYSASSCRRLRKYFYYTQQDSVDYICLIRQQKRSIGLSAEIMANTINVSNAPSLNVLDLSKGHTFVKPLKKINEGHDVPVFLTSKAYGDIMIFLLQLNRAMFPSYVRKSESDQKKEVHTWDLGSPEVVFSETVLRLRSLLEALSRFIDEVPPDTGPRRFGNASFRKWYQIVEEQSTNLLSQYLPDTILEYISKRSPEGNPQDEISSYLLGSFGSDQRLDYGSGHELSFLAFLGCIWKLGGFNTSGFGNEERGIVLGIIDPYLNLIRRLIKTYTLEPAGSHGVWGLDDHSFIPYIFGSAQYGPPISQEDQTPTEGSRAGAPKPADVAKKMAVDRERNTNLYFGAIGFIYDVKKGPFWEHSPMLYDISGVQAGWGKINKVSLGPISPPKRSLIQPRACLKCTTQKSSPNSPSSNISALAPSSAGSKTQTPHHHQLPHMPPASPSETDMVYHWKIHHRVPSLKKAQRLHGRTSLQACQNQA